MIKDYFILAYTSVRHRKIRSWLTMIGIFIGIAAVVALISLSQGLKVAISEQFVNLGSDKLIVQASTSGFGPPGTAVVNPLIKKDKDAIAKVQGVDTALGRLIRVAKLKFKDEIKFSYIVSLPEDNKAIDLAVEANNYKIDQGRFLEKEDSFKVVVGHDFADDFFDTSIQLRDRIEIQDNVFVVVGILKKSGNPQQDSTMIIPEDSFRKILDIEEDYDVVALKIKSGEDIDKVAEDIKSKLRKLRNVEEGKEDFQVETPGSLLAALNNILLIVQGVLVGIAAISLFVGGIGIMNTMYTAVVERTKEIGIMKATGANGQQILSLFLVESGMLGLFGGIIGVSLGISISKLIEYVGFKIYGSFLIRADIDPVLIFGALLFAFVVGATSGMLPAKRAGKLKPVDALRK